MKRNLLAILALAAGSATAAEDTKKTPPAPCDQKAKAIYFGTQAVLHHLKNPRTAKFGDTAAVCEVAGSLDKYLTKGYVDAKTGMGVEKRLTYYVKMHKDRSDNSWKEDDFFLTEE